MAELSIAGALPLTTAAVEASSQVVEAVIAGSLPLLTSAIEIDHPPVNDLNVTGALQGLTCAAGIVAPGLLAIAGSLRAPRALVVIKNKNEIIPLTGGVRLGGSTILMFKGPPNRSVEWAIVAGVGTLTPLTHYTDAMGKAYARLDPTSGTSVRVEVSYVP